jgi:hypothetical protein
MIIKRKPLCRRTFLRGCGVAMALPLFDAMHSTSFAAKLGRSTTTSIGTANSVDGKSINPATGAPTRLAFFYIPNGVVQTGWHPKETGENFTLSSTLKPLERVRDKITLLTKLDRVKVAGTDGHAQAGSCWLSSASPDEVSPAGYPLKRTIDQIVAAHTGKFTAFRSLELSCNPYQDNRESVYFDNISWYGHGHVARSLRDPKQVFDRLFAVDEHASHGSILDLVMEDAKSLERKLGRIDRGKLDEYMQSVRTIEKQIERVTKRQAEINKVKLQPPVKSWQAMQRDEFIQIMGDLMILALRTDLTRVSTLMTGPERWGSPLKVHGLFEKPIQHHGMTHNQGKANVKKDLEALDRFHVEQFAQLVAKMQATPEGAGSLLDNMIFTLGSGLSDAGLHICTDLPTVIAGGAGKQITPNRHLQYAKGTPIANLWVRIAQMMGVKTKRIGDSTGALTNLKA